MAARVLFPKRSVAAAALCGFALAPATVLAEAPKRKPIYEEINTPSAPVSRSPEAPTPPSPSPRSPEQISEHKRRSPTPTDRLALHVGRARLLLYNAAVSAEDAVNQTMDSAFHLEQSFTRTVASLAPSRESGEKLMPGAIYVLVAAMAGSIVTRRRNGVLRAVVPLALGLAASRAVLPVTMGNVGDLAWKYEQRFPAVAETHVRIREEVGRAVRFVRAHRDVGVRYVDGKVTDAREAVEGWVRQGK